MDFMIEAERAFHASYGSPAGTVAAIACEMEALVNKERERCYALLALAYTDPLNIAIAIKMGDVPPVLKSKEPLDMDSYKDNWNFVRRGYDVAIATLKASAASRDPPEFRVAGTTASSLRTHAKWLENHKPIEYQTQFDKTQAFERTPEEEERMAEGLRKIMARS